MKKVRIFTDGAARKNPGRGGYGVVMRSGRHRRELSGGFQKTTNNRMELMAVIAGLEALSTPCQVEVHSDSKYVIDALNKGWLARWKANKWRRLPEPLKNVDLWKRLDAARGAHQVIWKWVKGHAGHTENERCDELATGAADAGELEADEGFLAAQRTAKTQGRLDIGE